MSDDFLPDDDELELEPVDPSLLDHGKRLQERRMREAEAAAELEELSRKTRGGDPFSFGELSRFRFTIKHLLILTAVLAVVMTLTILTDGCSGVFIALIVTLVVAWFVTIRNERSKEAQLQRERREMEARHAGMKIGEEAANPRVERPVPVDINVAWEDANRETRPELKFAFSLKQLFVAVTVAAVLMALASSLGPERMAMIVGLVAILGIAIYATGIELPAMVVFCWWLLILFYLLIGLWAMTVGFPEEARAPTVPAPIVKTLADISCDSNRVA